MSIKTKVYQNDGYQIYKVCTICKKEEESITSLIHDNDLVYLTSSRISEEWVKKQNKEKLSFQQIIN